MCVYTNLVNVCASISTARTNVAPLQNVHALHTCTCMYYTCTCFPTVGSVVDWYRGGVYSKPIAEKDMAQTSTVV